MIMILLITNCIPSLLNLCIIFNCVKLALENVTWGSVNKASVDFKQFIIIYKRLCRLEIKNLVLTLSNSYS